jgi:hypothetical protein
MPHIENPFLLKGYVSPEYFCNREEETKKLVDAAVNGRDVTLFSLRRMGKSGLLDNSGYYLKKNHGFSYLYSDIYNTENISQLVSELTTNVIQQLYPQKSALDKIMRYFSHIRPSISFDSYSGAPLIQLDFKKPSDAFTSLEELFRMVNQHEKPVYWAIDEFQQINSYPETDNVLKQLRFLVQKSPQIRFVFSGSHTNMLISIFNTAKQPFYKSTQLLELKEIGENDYKAFIKKNFKKAKKTIEDKAIDMILESTLVHTWYTQALCNRLYQNYNQIDIPEVMKTLHAILQESEVTFYKFRQLLTKSQWEVLKAVGKEEKVFHPTSKDFIQTHKLGSSAAVLRSLDKLMNDEFIVEQYENGKKYYRVNDVFMIRWFQWAY